MKSHRRTADLTEVVLLRTQLNRPPVAGALAARSRLPHTANTSTTRNRIPNPFQKLRPGNTRCAMARTRGLVRLPAD